MDLHQLDPHIPGAPTHLQTNLSRKYAPATQDRYGSPLRAHKISFNVTNGLTLNDNLYLFFFHQKKLPCPNSLLKALLTRLGQYLYSTFSS